MTENETAAIARIDQRTADMAEHMKTAMLQIKINTSRLDVLETEHKARTAVSCNPTIQVPSQSFPKTLMALVGGSGVFGAGLILIIMLLLKKWGML